MNRKKRKEYIIQEYINTEYNQKSPTNNLPDLLIDDCATRVTPMSVIWLERRTKTHVHKKIHAKKKNNLNVKKTQKKKIDIKSLTIRSTIIPDMVPLSSSL